MSGPTTEAAATTPVGEGRPGRLLFVHAHPDDETIATGISLAHHAARGDDVHVLTCTLGEEGEVIPAELAHLEGAEGDPLAAHRREELRRALRRLGVTGHLLGAGPLEPGGAGAVVVTSAGLSALPPYRDSGMAGSAAAADPRAFAGADVAEAAALVRAVVEEVHPDVVVTYDRFGGYLHPDHVQTHRVTRTALRSMPEPPPLFAAVYPRSWVDEDRAWLAEHVDRALGWTVPAADEPYRPCEVEDRVVTHATVDGGAVAAQQEALREHATQAVVGDGWFVLSNRVAARLPGREGFARVDLVTGDLVPLAVDPIAGRRPGLLEEVSR